MPYNSLIDRTEAGALIPEEISREIIQGVVSRSVVLSMARRLPDMTAKQQKVPVLSSLPSAYFVSGDTGLKQTSEVVWQNKYLVAEEVAVIIPIPEAVLDDASYDIWGEIRPRIEEAFGSVIDKAVLLGTGIPSSWETNMGGAGVLGAAPSSHKVDLSNAESNGKDLYDVLLGEGGVFGLVEEDGFKVTGAVAALTLRSKLRGLREKVYNGTSLIPAGAPLFTVSMQEPNRYLLDGVPIEFPGNGSVDPSTALMFVGDWSNLVYSIRQDVTYKVLTEAVITDNTNAIIYNLAQQDMVALRAVMRLGVALPNPATAANSNPSTRFPFAVLVP
ncbi:MAG: phage major capsid protein [Candidatus Methanomethylicaceae archaeon]